MATNPAYMELVQSRKTKLLELIQQNSHTLAELETELKIGKQQILNYIKELRESHEIVNTRVQDSNGTRHIYEYRGEKTTQAEKEMEEMAEALV